MLPAVKRTAWLVLLALALVVRVAVPALATSDRAEQTITPITPGAEQRVEPVAPPGEQQVQALDAAGAQDIRDASRSPAGRAAHGIAKVAVGVVAAGVSLGVMVASLLFF